MSLTIKKTNSLFSRRLSRNFVLLRELHILRPTDEQIALLKSVWRKSPNRDPRDAVESAHVSREELLNPKIIRWCML